MQQNKRSKSNMIINKIMLFTMLFTLDGDSYFNYVVNIPK